MDPWENLPASPMGPQQPGKGIFNKMTTPTNRPTPTPAPGGPPTPNTSAPNSLAQFLSMMAQRNQSQFNPAQSYASKLPRGNPGDQSMHRIDPNSPLRNISTLLQSNPFNLDTFHDSNGMLDEAQFSSYNTIGGVPLFQKGENGEWTINPNGRYGELNNQFKGLDFRIEKDPYDNNKPKLVYNESALPRDAFGGFGGGDVEGFEDGRNGTLRNPNLVYDDPFYGRITDRRNMQQHENWMDGFSRMLTGTPLLLSLVTAGLGGALGGAGLMGGGMSPSTLLSLGQGAGGAMSGDYGRILQALISAGLPMSGLSGMPLQLARQGTGFFTNMLNNRGRGGG